VRTRRGLRRTYIVGRVCKDMPGVATANINLISRG
jgi:hypothetical protein